MRVSGTEKIEADFDEWHALRNEDRSGSQGYATFSVRIFVE